LRRSALHDGGHDSWVEVHFVQSWQAQPQSPAIS
jgi:hypothetical protein